jgi:membrane protease YdiL (CAAX protease family)
LLVVIPCCIIKFRFKERLADYGLGWKKEKVKLGLVALCFLVIGFAIFFYIGTFFPEQQAEYPMFRDKIPQGAWGAFIVYELVYFLFFIVIEFIFRGYILFGLYGIKDIQAAEGVEGIKGPYVFGVYAILIQMLPYIVWHLPKPSTEYLGALVWGIVVAAIALKTRSLWTIIIAHWLLNVFMDTVIWLKYSPVP